MYGAVKQNRQRKIILVLTIVLFIFVFFSLKIGTLSLSAKETLQGILGLSQDEKINIIIQNNAHEYDFLLFNIFGDHLSGGDDWFCWAYCSALVALAHWK